MVKRRESAARGRARNPGGMRLLLAHDVTSRTCDGLRRVIRAAFVDVDLVEVASYEHARAVLPGLAPDAALVCLDVPPAPHCGVRIAQQVMQTGHALVLVTRSLRWLPTGLTELRTVPWIAPEATASELRDAVLRAGRAPSDGAPATPVPPPEPSGTRAADHAGDVPDVLDLVAGAGRTRGGAA